MKKPNPQQLSSERAHAEEHHLRQIHELVQAGVDPDDVFYRLRESESGLADGVKKSAVDEIATDYAERWDSPPLVRAALQLFHDEVWLRNDVAEAVHNLDPADLGPDQIRGAMKLARGVAEGQGDPRKTMLACLDRVANAGIDVTELRKRLDAIFPEQKLPTGPSNAPTE